MDIVQLCEIGMLVALGFSWPFAVDVGLYFRNSALDRRRDASKS